MSDVKIPDNLVSWMESLMWGKHHDQWHFERRWDFWFYLAENGDADTQQMVKEMIRYAQSQNWKRAELQEGEAGNGMDFLMMHRAMLHLIREEFPDKPLVPNFWRRIIAIFASKKIRPLKSQSRFIRIGFNFVDCRVNANRKTRRLKLCRNASAKTRFDFVAGDGLIASASNKSCQL